MFQERIIRRLETIAVLPSTRAALATMVTQEWSVDDEEQQSRLAAIGKLYALLGGDDEYCIETLAAAWATLRAALARLDHLQDQDPEDHPLPTVAHTGAQYNIVFAYYLLASALLDDLDEHDISALRVSRLRRLWTDSLLQAASGQQEDLTGVSLGQDRGLAALDHYQQVAQAKSGAIFGLALGGAAILATDDAAAINACRTIGELYGTLIQFRDDLADEIRQTNSTLTLPQTYGAALSTYESQVPPHTLHPYWQYIYNAYRDQARQVLDCFPPKVQAGVLGLLFASFE